MPTLALGAVPGWLTRIMELRIDVDSGSWKLDNELESLYTRITRPGDRLHDMPEVKTDIPGMVLHYREADGEFYVYVVDTVQRRLAGYTVFNRLVEVGRRADSFLRAPHSKYDPQYQRRGLANAVYRWALDAGQCLMTGARQSAAARGLWQSLAAHYPSGYVDVRRKVLTYLGPAVPDAVLHDLHTRMVLLGRGWTWPVLGQAMGLRGPAPCLLP
ncbi:N-acetyltransferase [Bordetella petrii]|uniref:N-acetyltransferase n=1 Tax=Bordetella petrii TaxID=94624 RepID=UPI001E3B59A8|nr:N-acetyltransferase [Bordetella petrii]MCD0502660.1 N-acetyltransferase [Bordetella petrii]